MRERDSYGYLKQYSNREVPKRECREIREVLKDLLTFLTFLTPATGA
jgi:hypothetical protein